MKALRKKVDLFLLRIYSRKMNESKKTTRKKEKAGISCFGLNSDVNDTNLTDLSIHVQFAVYLCNSDRLEKFDIWFDNIAKLNPALLEDLMKNEEFCLCIVRLRLFQKKYQDVFQLLKVSKMMNNKKTLEINF